MAQILKDESRQAIIKSAKEEFLQKGYKNASMRSIAKKSHMTVGNLYRYFKNKEDINMYIVAPTFKEIDDALKKLTSNKVSMETRVYNLKPKFNELKYLLDEFADELVNIYWKHPTEFNILMLHSRLNEEMSEWFADIINKLISESFVSNELNKEVETLSRAYAESAFAGLRVIFRDSNCKANDLKILVKTYLRSFVYMLDNDVRKFAQ